MQDLIPAIVQQLKPTLDLILGNVTALEGRMAVVEEVKQLFPAKVEVTIRHDHGEGAKEVTVEDKFGHKIGNVVKEEK